MKPIKDPCYFFFTLLLPRLSLSDFLLSKKKKKNSDYIIYSFFWLGMIRDRFSLSLVLVVSPEHLFWASIKEKIKRKIERKIKRKYCFWWKSIRTWFCGVIKYIPKYCFTDCRTRNFFFTGGSVYFYSMVYLFDSDLQWPTHLLPFCNFFSKTCFSIHITHSSINIT